MFLNGSFAKRPHVAHMFNHGWWRLAVGGWRLAVGGGLMKSPLSVDEAPWCDVSMTLQTSLRSRPLHRRAVAPRYVHAHAGGPLQVFSLWISVPGAEIRNLRTGGGGFFLESGMGMALGKRNPQLENRGALCTKLDREALPSRGLWPANM